MLCGVYLFFRLTKVFCQPWEKAILQLVHHSFAPLETLIQEAQKLLSEQLVFEEEVVFTVRNIHMHSV